MKKIDSSLTSRTPSLASAYPFGLTTPLRRTRGLKLAVLGRDRSLPHFGRKFYHAVMGLFCFSLYAFVLTRVQALWILGTIGGVWFAMDSLRLRWPKLNELALTYFGGLMRREELKSLSANSFYILGMFFVVLAFSKPVALLSILFLALGDPTAAIIGTLYGRHKIIAKKSLEGAVANWAMCGVAAFIVGLHYFGLPLDRAILLALVGGLVSVVAELAPLPIDDNFTIPVLSGLQLSLVSIVLPLV